ncbi:hypothetical protein GCM10010211_66080 [Streptomyces albospinus]|uniref:DUF397 domain-containing protein n=1 Tax=Streptomyces albospinus TaxID=285515 RepID=A0ABQ2VM54_9ACTN|nr:DUF397 domain-containing protein [Streptomyces albospinus]GGU90323.1 hypothetical protein GCM10010211_66080 [Streptomyces albospinus]
MKIDPVKVTASDLEGANWFKSSYSNGGGNCVEAADNVPGYVPVRDSKAPQGPALMFSADGWSSFVAAVKGGEFHR